MSQPGRCHSRKRVVDPSQRPSDLAGSVDVVVVGAVSEERQVQLSAARSSSCGTELSTSSHGRAPGSGSGPANEHRVLSRWKPCIRTRVDDHNDVAKCIVDAKVHALAKLMQARGQASYAESQEGCTSHAESKEGRTSSQPANTPSAASPANQPGTSSGVTSTSTGALQEPLRGSDLC